MNKQPFYKHAVQRDQLYLLSRVRGHWKQVSLKYIFFALDRNV